MNFVEIRRRISASPERIWSVLTDVAALVSAETGIVRIEGAIEPGSRMRLWSEVNPDRAFMLKVTAFDPYRNMVWSGGLPFGLFFWPSKL